MTHLINLTNQRFGRLTVLERAANNPVKGEVTWICRCDCGEITKARRSVLRRGTTVSCGCYKREVTSRAVREAAARKRSEKVAAMIGRRFTRLVITGQAEGSKGLRYACQCDCGTQTTVNAHDLARGLTRSCGCLRREYFRRNLAHRPREPHTSLAGQTFNHLTVVRALPRETRNQRLECRCVCGSLTIATSSDLKAGNKRSCGCKQYTDRRARLSPIAQSWQDLVMHRPRPLFDRETV